MTHTKAALSTSLFLLLTGCPADDLADTDIDGTSSTGAVSSSDSHSTTVNSTDVDASSTGEGSTSTSATSGSDDDGTSDAASTSDSSTTSVEITSSTSGETDTGEVCEYGVHCPNTDDCPVGQVCATEFGTLPVCVSPCDAVNDCTNAAAQCEGLSLHCAADAGTGANLCFPD